MILNRVPMSGHLLWTLCYPQLLYGLFVGARRHCQQLCLKLSCYGKSTACTNSGKSTGSRSTSGRYWWFLPQLFATKKGSKDLLEDGITAYLRNVQPIAAQLTINWNVLAVEMQNQPGKLEVPRERSSIAEIVFHLGQIGAIVTTGSRAGAGRVDIVATIPALGASFNPVLIEVKRHFSNTDSDLQQMRRYLLSIKARLGLIVYTGGVRSRAVHTDGSTGILLLPVREIMSWDGDRLVNEITKLRNQVVHSAL